MVSHIDDDHINGIQKLTDALAQRGARQSRGGEVCPLLVQLVRRARRRRSRRELAGEAGQASLQSLERADMPEIDDEHGAAAHAERRRRAYAGHRPRRAEAEGNKPVIGGLVMAKKGQTEIRHRGRQGDGHRSAGEPASKALRKDWAKALKKPTKKARQAALQELFLPDKKLDKSIPNLSSIVVLVKVGGKKFLLTGDAHGGTSSRPGRSLVWGRAGQDRSVEDAAPRQHPEHDRGLSEVLRRRPLCLFRRRQVRQSGPADDRSRW